MIKICLSGLGRAGLELARIVLEQKDMKLVAAICGPESTKKGQDVGRLLGGADTGVLVEGSDRLEETIFRSKPDVVIDFSTAEAAIRNAVIFSKMKVNIVMCTTGFSRTSINKLRVLARKYGNGIAYTPNITLGINVMMLLTNLAANLLNNYDFQITEVHHKRKKDSPSGTASKIAAEVEKGLQSSGIVDGLPSVPIHAVRAGGVVGRHEVMVIGEEDQLQISHESFSRRAFALGALRAARFMVKKSGYFEMNEILDLKKALNDYLESHPAGGSRRVGGSHGHAAFR